MKRLIDLAVSLTLTLLTAPIVFVLVIVATADCRCFGLFVQERVGRHGHTFRLLKIRSMRTMVGAGGTVTASDDPRITTSGAWLRRFKLDELPQFWCVLAGTMSLVGPRPDVPGYADELEGEDREILRFRPGITGPASLAFRNEETLLSEVADCQTYNDSEIWPAKVAINLAYVQSGSLRDDIELLILTLRPSPQRLARLLSSWDPSLLAIGPIVAAFNFEEAA